jgi:ectoine hydroxylase-related dioxygenase (phytanoyl-CoA dioxygenase family)
MARLTVEEIARFQADGYLVVDDVVDAATLAALRRDLDAWVEESRAHPGNWGETIDGRARFDCEAGHNADDPKLRRVNNPAEVSEAYERALVDGALVEAVADLIGPDVKVHHSKINLKRPGMATRVGYHQDFSFTPHTNDDLVTALIALDPIDLANGPLRVVPGSHREGQVSLWRDGVFTGQVDEAAAEAYAARSIPLEQKPASACLMHTSLMHGSDPNRSSRPRGLYICVYAAADAFPLAPSPLPNRFEGRIVRGRAHREARLMPGRVELPAQWKHAAFFAVQGQQAAVPLDG